MNWRIERDERELLIDLLLLLIAVASAIGLFLIIYFMAFLGSGQPPESFPPPAFVDPSAAEP